MPDGLVVVSKPLNLGILLINESLLEREFGLDWNTQEIWGQLDTLVKVPWKRLSSVPMVFLFDLSGVSGRDWTSSRHVSIFSRRDGKLVSIRVEPSRGGAVVDARSRIDTSNFTVFSDGRRGAFGSNWKPPQ